MTDDESLPEITRTAQKKFTEQPEPDDDAAFDDAERIVARESKIEPVQLSLVPVFGGAFTIQRGRRGDVKAAAQIAAPDLKSLLDVRDSRYFGAACRVAIDVQLKRARTGAKVIAVTTDLATALEALRRPNPRPAVTLSNWEAMQGLSVEQSALVVKYRPFALSRAKQFWQRCRLGRDHLDDACGIALMAMCRAARTFDPSKGWAFPTLARHWVDGGLKRWRLGERKRATASSDEVIGEDEDGNTLTIGDMVEGDLNAGGEAIQIEAIRLEGLPLVRAAAMFLSAVEHDILTGRLLPDKKVPQAELAAKYNVSVPRISYLEGRTRDKVIARAQARQELLLAKKVKVGG